MKQALKFFKEALQFLAILLLVLLGICLLILLSPILIPLWIYTYFSEKAFDKEYTAYLKTIDGTKFFCYHSRRSTLEYIQTKIIPLLPSDVKIIFLDGKTPKSDYEQKYISKALYSIKSKKGFPYLLKISNGELLDQSIKGDMYNTMNQGRDINVLSEKINKFYQNV